MSPMLALRLATYLLVCDGVASLFLAGLIGPLWAALVVLAMLGSWWLERARERGVVRASVAWGLVATAAVAIAMDLAYLAPTALDGMVHLLLFLILGRLFLRRSLRDLRDAGFLSFFLLVATSSVTFSVSFLFVFVTFVLLATWMLMLHHIVAETERASDPVGPPAASRVGFRSQLARVSLVAAAGRSRPTRRWSCASTCPTTSRSRRSCPACAGAASCSTASTGGPGRWVGPRGFP
ncbi:MAG: hypothetical protein DMD86_17210 [Candidatus Rokuibacteriota bacterium]|nr:MAG: hypothetical protein DMD86_17210 [Candidatus Rokubacteria bacterium]